MTIKSGGRKVFIAGAVLAIMMSVSGTTPAGAQGIGATGHDAARMQANQHPAAFLKGFFTATIDVMSYAARSTSDTVHHNLGNAMGTVAKARGFVRDTVSGVLGNARKVTGMVGDVMPFTGRHHYEGGAAQKKTAE